MKKISLFLMAATLLLSSFFLGCQNNVATDITTGSVQGSVTLNGTTDEVLGLDVFIAGTSFVSKVAADGKYEISNIPANAGYVLCVQKGEETQIIKENVEVKAGEVTVIETATILSSEWIQSSLVWKGNFETAPENPEINWAYFNTTDGCSYIWDGTTWSLLAGAGKDGIIDGTGNKDDFIKYYDELDDFISKSITINRNKFAENYQIDIPITDKLWLPDAGDKFKLNWTFTSDIEIKNLRIAFADCSTYVNTWKDLSPDTIIESIPAGKEVSIEKTITLTEKAIGNVTLIVRYNVVDTDAVATLTTSSSTIVMLRGDNSTNNPDAQNKFTCTPTEEGIKFTGSLLSNIPETTAKCVISIQDITNGITMYRDYSLPESTYESWEMIYPLVEKGKKYTFEVKMEYQANVIHTEKFTVTAVGGLGEYKIENADSYTVTLSKDKKSISRTKQNFTDNSNVQKLIIDFGTQYDLYSNNDKATSVWDGIWIPSKQCWNITTNQIGDFTQWEEDWYGYESFLERLRGRRLGIVSRTIIKIAGYTYNNTTRFFLNDYKETFFDWDDEEEDKIFILYQNPVTKKYYEDVPGTSLYYIEKDLDENGNVKFAKKGDADAIEVYGKLISFGDKIYEPTYVPEVIKDYIFTGLWNYSYMNESWSNKITFPCASQDKFRKNDCVPIILSPEYKPEQYKIFFVDENGNQILEPIVTKNEEFTLPSIPDRENYFCYNWEYENNICYPNSDVTLTKFETTFVADYKIRSIHLTFYDEDGSLVRGWSEHNNDTIFGNNYNSYFYEYGNYISFYNVSTPSAPETDETKDFSHWECQETGQTFSAEENINRIDTVSTELNFIAVYK